MFLYFYCSLLSKIGDTINLAEKNSPSSRLFHRFNYHNYNQTQLDEFIKTILVIFLILISLVLLASSLCGMIVCLRFYMNSSVETVGTWKVLPEESKV